MADDDIVYDISSFIQECKPDGDSPCMQECEMGAGTFESVCTYHQWQCYGGIGPNGTAACDCNRYFGCYGDDCGDVGKTGTFFWVFGGSLQCLVLLIAGIRASNMLHKLRVAGNLDFNATSSTLVFNVLACFSGLLFIAQMWLVRPLTCSVGSEEWSFHLTDILFCLYPLFGVLMMLNIGLIWVEVAKATRALKSRKSSGLDKTSRYQKAFMGAFMAMFVGGYAAGGSYAAAAVCMIPAIVFMIMFPYGATQLVRLLQGRKPSPGFKGQMRDIWQFVCEGSAEAFYLTAQQRTVAQEQLALSMGANARRKHSRPSMHIKAASSSTTEKGAASYEDRLKRAASAVSNLCLRLMFITFCFFFGNIWYGSIATDKNAFETNQGAGNVNMSHFAFLVSMVTIPFAMLEVQKYLDYVLRNAVKKKQSPSTLMSPGEKSSFASAPRAEAKEKKDMFGRKLKPRPVGVLFRTVMVNNVSATLPKLKEETARSGGGLSNNKVVTAQYTAVNFVPFNFWRQMKRVTNRYFAMICVMQMVPQISNSRGVPTVAGPLVCVLVITAVKDAFEDYGRHMSDKMENSRPTAKLSSPSDQTGTPISAEKACVGDVIMIKNRELIPADVVLLASSEGQNASVMTANLDGETNLKVREVPADLLKDKNTLMAGTVECDLPNDNLESFTGNIKTGSAQISLTSRNVLLRGCMLRQTEWVKGVVVYAGAETKIQMNSSEPPQKESALMKYTNVQTKYAVMVMAAFCLIGGICGSSMRNTPQIRNSWYLQEPFDGLWGDPFIVGIQKFFSFFLLFTNFIPISLDVTLMGVKFVQAIFMAWDLKMYHEIEDHQGHVTQFPMKVNTSDLNEELGMVEQVFSDKTGTLTCNVMDYRKCSINGVSYGQGTTEIGKAYMLRNGIELPPEPVPEPGAKKTPHVNFIDPGMQQLLASKSGAQYMAVEEFYLHLALNHEVQPELHNGATVYSASNPDEAAMVYAAKHFGFEFESNEVGTITVLVDGQKRKYELLYNLEFSSDRKRSSVIVKKPDGVITLYCKGADNVIKKRLSAKNSQELLDETYKHLDAYVNDGLRTLLVGSTDIPSDKFGVWREKFDNAAVAMDGREEKMADLMEEIEQDLILQGSTAIEDKLQDGVSDTLSSLREGGILVWMLTGDKVDTAINIGHSCSLLTTEMDQLRLVADDGIMALDKDRIPTTDGIKDELKKLLNHCQIESDKHDEYTAALIVDTGALAAVLRYEMETEMLSVCAACKSVICARVSPKQKAKVVDMVRRARPEMVTLAIGDGANDVPMIQTANVGIGIFGLEGKQAVMCADYALGQFRFLKPLLLVHGRWHYRRISLVIAYVFYKSTVQVLPQFWFGFSSIFSAQVVYYDAMYQVYNVMYTSTPICCIAVWDQDVSAAKALATPSLYYDGLEGRHHSTKIFWTWMAEAWFHSLCVYYLPVLAYGKSSIFADGTDGSIWEIGLAVFLGVVLTVTLRLAFELKMVTKMAVFFMVISIFFFVATWSYYNQSITLIVAGFGQIYGTFPRLTGSDGNGWFVYSVLGSCVMCLMTSITREAFATSFKPTPAQVAREQETMGPGSKIAPRTT